jgi:hypothetical protein
MKRSAVAILLSLFLGCLAYQLFIYYKPYFSAITATSSGTWIVIITCALVPFLAILAAFTIPSSRSKSSAQPRRPPAAQPRRSPAAQTHKQEELQRQLIRLLYGDADTARRLLYLSIERNSDRDMVWHLEKTIQELIRDRSR